MWHLKNPVTRLDDAHQIKLNLQELPGLIHQIIHFEVGINKIRDAAVCDVVLLAQFKSQ